MRWGRRGMGFVRSSVSWFSKSRISRRRWWILCFFVVVEAWCIPLVFANSGRNVETGGRSLLAITENQGNASFQCSPRGPCLRCQYSEKNDDKYRCSETGYHMPLKCVEIQKGEKEGSEKNLRRILLESSSKAENGQQSYVTYRSCIPIEPEEKLSILGFEVIMISLLLISAPIAYYRQKRLVPMAGGGPVRIPNTIRL